MRIDIGEAASERLGWSSSHGKLSLDDQRRIGDTVLSCVYLCAENVSFFAWKLNQYYKKSRKNVSVLQDFKKGVTPE